MKEVLQTYVGEFFKVIKKKYKCKKSKVCSESYRKQIILKKQNQINTWLLCGRILWINYLL